VNESGVRPARELRLFFALWPSGAQRAALAVAAAPAIGQVDGQPVPPTNLHVTLAFLGMVPGRTLAHLIEAGGQGPRPAVELNFERLEFWAKPKVLVAMPSAVPETGQEIVDRLWTSVAPLGFERELRPWQPHLTLVRRVRRPPPENLPLAPVENVGDESPWRLALVESTSHPDGIRYKPLADWPLAAGGDSPL
jgi:2'-5' RNA ligase